ncbi:MAG: hypothetical protein JXB06_08450 [Spirochaetales bacterium]|nr:hypothetical protein [Spirochaetales bacterium]
MIGFRLHLKHRADGRVFFTIPLGYKILLLAIGLLILVSLIVTPEPGAGNIFIRENTIPLIICLFSLLGAAYHECWIFDRKLGRVTYQNGLIALHSNRVYRIEDLEGVEVSQFVRGKAGSAQQVRRTAALRPIVTLSLQTGDGRSLRLENYRPSQIGKVEATGRAIAEHCGIPYEILIQGSK